MPKNKIEVNLTKYLINDIIYNDRQPQEIPVNTSTVVLNILQTLTLLADTAWLTCPVITYLLVMIVSKPTIKRWDHDHFIKVVRPRTLAEWRSDHGVALVVAGIVGACLFFKQFPTAYTVAQSGMESFFTTAKDLVRYLLPIMALILFVRFLLTLSQVSNADTDKKSE